MVLDVKLMTQDQPTQAKEVVFEMSETHATNRGTVPEVRGTMSLYYFYRTPVIKAESRVFDDSLLVTIESPDGGMILFGPHQ